MTKDLTQGRAVPLILSFSIPLILGNLFQQLYNLVDTIIVGRYLGVAELAAVGATGAINFLILGFVSGLCAGMAIPIAQRFGAKDEEGLRRYVANSIWLAVVFSVIMTPLMMIFTKRILVLMRTPEDILEDAYIYIVTIFAGIPLIFLYNLVASVIRALGDSKTPLYFLLFASVLNVGLDIVSIRILGMGVLGPALATVFSQGISGVLCLIYMGKRFPILRLGRSDMRPDTRSAGRLLGVGVPMGLQYSITAIGSVVLQSAVNTLGSTAVAAVTASSRIGMLFANCELDSLGSAMATYCGQNLGAGKYDRIIDGVKKAMVLGIGYSICGFLIMYFFSGKLAMLFVSDPSEIELIGMVRRWTVCNSIFYSALCILSVLRFSIQGLGFSTVAISSGVAEMIARCIVAFCFVGSLGFTAICFANPLAWIFGDLALIPSFCFVTRKVKKHLKICQT